jgi:hypothetical protein
MTTKARASDSRQGIARLLPGAKRVEAPTYEQDRVGAIQHWDERDILFARHDLFREFGPDTP